MGSHLESYSSTSPPLPVGDLLVVGRRGRRGRRARISRRLSRVHGRARVAVGIRFRSAAKQVRRPGWARRSNMAAAPRGCPGRTIRRSISIYWAIGNPCPDIAGEERIGDNLYTSSVVALAAKTGADEVVLPVHAARHARLGCGAADAARRRNVAGPAAQAADARRPQRHVLRPRPHQRRSSCSDANLSTKVTWLKGFTRGRQADRRSRVDRDQRGRCRVPGRRRRRKLSRQRRTTR